MKGDLTYAISRVRIRDISTDEIYAMDLDLR